MPRAPIPPLFLFLLLLMRLCAAAQSGPADRPLWCVAKNNAADEALQSAIDWACGAGGANCRPIQSGGPCYSATDVQVTASWAFNDYFLSHGLADDACYFSNTAAIISLDPSYRNCHFPSSLSVSNGSIHSPTTYSPVGMGPDSADLNSANQYRGLSSSPFLIVLFTLVSAWCCIELTCGYDSAFL